MARHALPTVSGQNGATSAIQILPFQRRYLCIERIIHCAKVMTRRSPFRSGRGLNLRIRGRFQESFGYLGDGVGVLGVIFQLVPHGMLSEGIPVFLMEFLVFSRSH